jgi:SAM-dependent methyltransferase
MPCGYGRHSILAASFGYEVRAVDLDAKKIAFLNDLVLARPTACHKIKAAIDDALSPRSLNETFDVAIVVDFPVLRSVSDISHLVSIGGHIIFETVANRGRNWIQLPRASEVFRSIKPDWEVITYREARAGPSIHERVTVKMFARRIR